MMNLIIQIFLWAVIIVGILVGGTMTTLLVHAKKHPENREASEKWMHVIQTFFWFFVMGAAVIGLIIFVISTQSSPMSHV